MTRTYAESRDILTALREGHREQVRAGGKPSLECPATRALRTQMQAQPDGTPKEKQDA